jgi:MGT family glycosyltransferase
MARLGAFCFPGSGHINPMTAVARALELRGHSVVIFGIADIESRVQAAGIEFRQLGAADYPPGTLKLLDERLGELHGLASFRFTVERVKNTTRMILRDSPAAVREAGIDALLVDEADMSGTVAEHLGLPFISIAMFPPLIQDDRVPPFCFGWRFRHGRLCRIRNRLGMRLLSWVAAPIFNLVNAQRKEWGLKPLKRSTDALSRIAQIAQLPEVLEFESAPRPKNLHYTGPFVNAAQRPAVEFPWSRLDGRRLVYASLGTLQNGSESVFRTVAEACSDLDIQLVISLGGGLEPERLGRLAGGPVVVSYAPQLEILKRAAAVITHAGLNTVLESLSEGVPIVAIPMGNDQPGVAARVQMRRAGVVVPRSKLSPRRLRHAVRFVLEDGSYRAAARELSRKMRQIDGPAMAAEIIEKSLELSTPSRPVQFAS